MITQKNLSELNIRPFKGTIASVHARKDYPVTQGPVKIAHWPRDNKFYVVQNIGNFLKAKSSNANAMIDVETLPWPADDPRAMQMTLLEFLELPMRASEAENLLESWNNLREKAVAQGIIDNMSQWPRPATYGLIGALFEAYQDRKLRSTQARIIQKLPHDAQQLLVEHKFPYKLKLSPNACSVLLEIFNEQDIDSFIKAIGQPQKLEHLARDRQNEENNIPAVASECQALEKTDHTTPIDIEAVEANLADITITEEMKKELDTEEAYIQAIRDTVRKSWQSLAKALTNIFTKKLFAVKGYTNFGKYCKEELGMDPMYAYKCVRRYSGGPVALSKDIQTTFEIAGKFMSLPEECRNEMKETGYYTLSDGNKILLEGLLDKTCKDAHEEREKIRIDYENRIKRIEESAAQRDKEMLEKLEEEKTNYDNLCADYQELSNECDRLKKEAEQINGEIKEKQKIIEEMGLNAAKQQEIGAENKRKELEKEITKLKKDRELKVSELTATKQKLSTMTHLHGEAVKDIEKLKKMTPEQIADMHAKEKVYNFLIGERWMEEQARAVVDEISNDYESNKEYVAQRQEEIKLNALIADRDDTLAHLYHILSHQVKPAIAFYALKKQQIPMNETALRYYNTLIAELETATKLLKHAHAWWQDTNGSDPETYHNTAVELLHSNIVYHDPIPQAKLPSEVQDYIKSL